MLSERFYIMYTHIYIFRNYYDSFLLSFYKRKYIFITNYFYIISLSLKT